jgi:hypothetical protein
VRLAPRRPKARFALRATCGEGRRLTEGQASFSLMRADLPLRSRR